MIPIDRFKESDRLKIAVIGDFMLDRYLWGTANRISPESPVPIVVVEKETESLGAAGNVASNVRSLGAQVIPIGIVGKDKSGTALTNLLDQIGCRMDYMVTSSKKTTTTKTRVLAQKQQVVRIDREDVSSVDEELELIKSHCKGAIEQSNIVIISDYGKGVCSQALLAHVIGYANKIGVPTIVDPKAKDFIVYKGCTCITPNLNELNFVVPFTLNTTEEISRAGQLIKDKMNFKNVVITRGKDGMSILSNGEIFHLPTDAKEVFDVSGAGDTVISTLAVSLGLGFNYIESAKIANVAAGIVVAHIGTVPISLKALQEEFYKKERGHDNARS